jgi:NADP-dependent aldehyde dehydrogenase
MSGVPVVTLQPVLVAGAWRQSIRPAGTFSAVDPSTRTPLADVYPVSTRDEVNAACEAGHAAAFALRAIEDREDRIATFLDDYAGRIDAAADMLCEMATRETAYPVTPRLKNVEIPRTTNQLRQGAAAARGRSWSQATIDTKANIRSCYGALGGPVVVFGPNNFPFAFNSIAGGDFVAAVAAGNPVIAKANTGHPGTSRLLAELAFEAAEASGLPPAMVQLLYRTPPDVGFALVSHPAIAATGFTGSKHAGLQLKAAADRAGKPIYLEMSSVNPIFVLPAALDERLAAIAKELAESCALGAGQFCTRPGVTVVPLEPHGEAFVRAVSGHFEQATPGTLLGASVLSGVMSGLEELCRHGAAVVVGGTPVDAPAYRVANTLLRVSGDAFLANPHALQAEAFGSVNMVVLAKDLSQMTAIAASLEGNLTGCVYSDTAGRDDEAYATLAPVLRQRVGRLLNDKMPTGVAVSAAMNHGGPYPATGHPGFTAVGIPASLLRFAALHAYDNVRPHRLPPELRNQNPTGSMWRSVDGAWTTGDVAQKT